MLSHRSTPTSISFLPTSLSFVSNYLTRERTLMGLSDLFGSKRKPGFNKGDKSSGGKFKKAPPLKTVVPTSSPIKKIESQDIGDLVYGTQTPQIRELMVRFNKITAEDNERLFRIKTGGDEALAKNRTVGDQALAKNRAVGDIRGDLVLKTIRQREPWASRMKLYHTLNIEPADNTKRLWATGAFNNALLALFMKDLIGNGFAQKDYDTLMEVWKEGITDLD